MTSTPRSFGEILVSEAVNHSAAEAAARAEEHNAVMLQAQNDIDEAWKLHRLRGPIIGTDPAEAFNPDEVSLLQEFILYAANNGFRSTHPFGEGKRVIGKGMRGTNWRFNDLNIPGRDIRHVYPLGTIATSAAEAAGFALPNYPRRPKIRDGGGHGHGHGHASANDENWTFFPEDEYTEWAIGLDQTGMLLAHTGATRETNGFGSKRERVALVRDLPPNTPVTTGLVKLYPVSHGDYGTYSVKPAPLDEVIEHHVHNIEHP